MLLCLGKKLPVWEVACQGVIAISVHLLLSIQKCKIEENVKQSAISGLERLA